MLFFATNYLGIAGLESIRNCGLCIPQELAVICFDDRDIFRLHTPAITCIRQPIGEIGKNAVHMLVSQIEGKKAKQKINRLLLAAKLIFRKST